MHQQKVGNQHPTGQKWGLGGGGDTLCRPCLQSAHGLNTVSSGFSMFDWLGLG